MSNADEIPTHEELNLRDQIRDAIKIGRFDLVGGLLGQFHQDGGLLTKFGVEVIVSDLVTGIDPPKNPHGRPPMSATEIGEKLILGQEVENRQEKSGLPVPLKNVLLDMVDKTGLSESTLQRAHRLYRKFSADLD